MKKITFLFALLCVSMMGWAVNYCNFATGHQKDANFGDASGRVLLTLQKNGNNVIVKIKNNNDNGNPQTGLNFLWVNATGATNNNATYGSHSAANAEEISVTVEFSASQDSYTFNNIHWSYAGWGGEWAIDGLTVSASELCEGVSCTDETNPTVSAVSVGSVTYNMATLTITASDNEGGSGIAQYIVKNGDTQIASSASNVITLTGLTPNTTYNNIKVFAQDACNNESSAFAVESFSTQPRPSECEGSRGHEGGSPHLDFVISYDGTTTTLTATPKGSGIEFDFFQINVNGTTSDLMGGESTKASVEYTTNVASGTELYIAFLYSPTDFGGNYQTTGAFQANSNDPNIIYYKVGDCSASSADEEKPSMAAASVSVDSKTHNSVVLAISGATDNVAVTKYVVKNHSDNSAVGECTPAEGKITVSSLSPSTAYDWDVYAKDAAGNVSDNCKNITFTTNALVSNYCGETLINGDHSIALTCEMVSAGNYRITIEGTNLAGIGGSFYTPGNVALNTKITSSSSTRIVCDIAAASAPSLYTSLYVNMPGEVSFTWPDDIVWGSCPAVAVTGVSLNHSELEMQVGGATQTLVATITPANATNQNVTWESDDTDVATVDNGVVTAVGAGTATITVTTQDGSFTAQCEVTVTVPAVAKTVYNGYATTDVKNIFILYSVTRNVDQTLTFKLDEFEYLPALFGFVDPEVWIGNTKLGSMSIVDGKYTFTTADTYTPSEEALSCKFHFVYGGGGDKYITFSYTVGSEQDVPATIPVGAVVLNKASNTLSVGETDNLTATVYPSFATSAGSITWASDAIAYATVDAGTVTAVAAGSANITATCGEVTSAPYEVTVTTTLTEAKFYGCGAFVNNAGKVVAYDYVFTRATNHNVTLDVVFSRSMSGIISNGNFMIYINGVNQHMTYTDATQTATYDFGSQAEEASINYYFYFPLDGGGLHQIPQTAYVVGSTNDAVHAFAIGENEANNVAALADADGQTFDKVFVNRSFAADNLYTLVLPFDVDASQMATVLPGKLTKLNNSYVKENGDLRVNFVDADAIEAGVPYLYEASAGVVNPVFSNVTISKDLNPTEPDELAKYYGIYTSTTGEALKTISNAYVLGSDQYLYAAEGLRDDQQMKALRGYFVLNFPSNLNQAPNRRARIIFNNQETEVVTGMEDVQLDENQSAKMIKNGQLFIIRDGKMYNAQGQLMK